MKKLLFLVFCLGSFANAANWYVRPTAQGSNSGTSWTNAWSVNSIAWASVNAGDTIWMAGGTYNTGGFDVGKSGASGNPITMKRVLATDSVPVAASGWSAGFDSQVILNGTSTGNGMFSWTSGSTGSNFTVDGRFKYGIAVRLPMVTNGASGGQQFFGGVSVSNITFQYCDLGGPGWNSSADVNYASDCSAAFNNRGGNSIDNLQYLHCDIHGAPNLFYNNGTVTNLLVEDCDIRDSRSGNANVHANIFWNVNSSGGPIVFRNNRIHNWQVEGFLIGEGSGSCQWEFDGNIFYDQSTGVATVFWPWSNTSNQAQGPLILYNNTFYNVTITSNQDRSWQFKTGSISRNNIFWGSSFSSNSVISDRNYNFSSGSETGANSISSGSNPFVNPTGSDFHIIGTISSTLPRDKGTNLGSPYNVDIDGETRGADGTWDMGAFEYPSADTTPPIISNATINSAGTGLSIVFNDNITTSSSDNSGWALTASGGAVTMSYSSGTDSTTILYSLNRTISGSETVTIAYTQPGNGVEDVSLNDLATVAGVPVANNSTQGKTATPAISLASGPYFGTQSVSLSCTSPSPTIYYTTDGTAPTVSSNVYSSAISLSTNTTLRTFATSSGLTNSDEAMNVYEINSWTITGAWKTFSVPQQTGTFTWSFDAEVDTVATDAVVGLSPTVVDAYGDFSPNIQFYSDNTILARNGTGYASVNAISYTPGTTYHFDCTVNVTNDTYSVTVTPEGGSPVVLATNYAFRNTATELDNVGMTSLVGTLSVSNMQVGSAQGSINCGTINVTNLRIGP